jgi:group II intron reverse transcriptase/maturase
VGLNEKVSWVLDADIRGFFDSLDHGWLVKFLEHRVADKRVVRLIQKWLNAGVVVDGEVTRSEVGTVQGGSVSPLLANIYLHYVFDLWVQRWRKTEARGELIVVRYADDFIVGFQYRDDAERFLRELRVRFAEFALELHPEKTRLLQFGRFADQNRRGGGKGKPETFNFLGFTHICGKTRQGGFKVLRQTMRQRWRAKLSEVKAELRRRMHRPVPEQGQYLRAVVGGHVNYYGVPGNSPSIGAFRGAVIRLWHRTLCRRSQTPRLPWKRMTRYVARWIPPARVSHPYPEVRFDVTT